MQPIEFHDPQIKRVSKEWNSAASIFKWLTLPNVIECLVLGKDSYKKMFFFGHCPKRGGGDPCPYLLTLFPTMLSLIIWHQYHVKWYFLVIKSLKVPKYDHNYHSETLAEKNPENVGIFPKSCLVFCFVWYSVTVLRCHLHLRWHYCY